MNFINQLLLNMLIIISAITLFQIFWMDRQQKIESLLTQTIFASICALSALFCMSHPMRLTEGLQFDFRMIPLAICLLNISWRPSLIVVGSIIAYLIYYGSNDVVLYGNLLSCLLSVVLVLCCRLLVMLDNRRKNVMNAALLGFLLGIVTSILTYCLQVWVNATLLPLYLVYYTVFSLLQGVTLGIIIRIIEQIKENMLLRQQSQDTEKINVLSGLAASFAHEIRNPMTVARGFMQILKQPGISEEKRQIYTSMVVEEIDKAQTIVNDYLTFAKPQLEAIELLDAKPLILEALHSIEPYAKLCHVDVEAKLDDKLYISANRDKFAQCMMHLCKNGIEAMPNGGKLQVIGTVQNHSVCIDIIDHGVGMTPEEIRRLGTPFYSTRDKGTGLGMMVTYRVIQMIQGKIDVTSEVGKGTCFSLLIPSLHIKSYH
ncbi:ATP-binding protein [Paenibacillus rigui]|uniref:histidine kinase n=1 Tax=Paenibacillus rigui TaxID=554312 RepID=A0A229UT24_9BACL|nr:ATP-binding protein [Paenibacillus rigui]OXM86787.1 two-component sensor histidine kinase [Paenibacillus rigui]